MGFSQSYNAGLQHTSRSSSSPYFFQVTLSASACPLCRTMERCWMLNSSVAQSPTTVQQRQCSECCSAHSIHQLSTKAGRGTHLSTSLTNTDTYLLSVWISISSQSGIDIDTDSTDETARAWSACRCLRGHLPPSRAIQVRGLATSAVLA